MVPVPSWAETASHAAVSVWAGALAAALQAGMSQARPQLQARAQRGTVAQVPLGAAFVAVGVGVTPAVGGQGVQAAVDAAQPDAAVSRRVEGEVEDLILEAGPMARARHTELQGVRECAGPGLPGHAQVEHVGAPPLVLADVLPVAEAAVGGITVAPVAAV